MKAWTYVRIMLLMGMIACTFIAPARAGFIDEFDGFPLDPSQLDPSWGPVQTDPTGFFLQGTVTSQTAVVSGGTWNISGLTVQTQPTVGNVYVVRNVASMTTGDFRFTMDFTGKSGPNSDVGHVSANFLDASNRIVAAGGWHDHAGFSTNSSSMLNLGNLSATQYREINDAPTQHTNFTGVNNGHGRLQVSRTGSNYSLGIGFVSTASFVNYNSIPLTHTRIGASINASAIQSLMLRFGYYTGSGLTHTPLAIDRVELTTVPEPGTLGLLACCTAIGALVTRRNRSIVTRV